MRVGSPKLLKASVYATDYESCRQIYARTNDSRAVSDNMFCAWASGKDSCHGDSGGPAVVGGKLAGLVSFGDVCGSPHFPGVYTQLHNYLAWIAEVMGEQRSGIELYSSQPNVQKDPDVEEESSSRSPENVDGEEEGEYVDVDDYNDDSFWHKAVDFTKSKVNAIPEKFGFAGPIWKRYLSCARARHRRNARTQSINAPEPRQKLAREHRRRSYTTLHYTRTTTTTTSRCADQFYTRRILLLQRQLRCD
ncbi:unnamed protein product [Trichogramma brassicae]|uniref:Peptidase S1 domain-containing protein n=1 Tax=Trichogramma brassicae TaxID=86971 RepID=A0A6H5IKD8_9HYME|nr:unnamed protein product [Trichogramma brassicae]